ncbi:MAG: PilZ domain-containing protein, partial [Thermodesulfovibrionia bacterium]|nr:PilZ domain-containing protein [Thermodesulfovibrionia bacterium]
MEEETNEVHWERRFSGRVSYPRSGMFGLPSEKPQFVTHIMNLSETGIFMNTSDLFDLGTKVHLVIREKGKYIKVEGVVTRVIKKDPSNLFGSDCGMGVRFIKSSEE